MGRHKDRQTDRQTRMVTMILIYPRRPSFEGSIKRIQVLMRSLAQGLSKGGGGPPALGVNIFRICSKHLSYGLLQQWLEQLVANSSPYT